MSVGSNVLGVVCVLLMMVPPLCAPGTSLAGPLAAASMALVAVVSLPPPWFPPELLSFLADGLPQPAMPMASAAVAATASLNRLAISPPLISNVHVTVGCEDRTRHGRS